MRIPANLTLHNVRDNLKAALILASVLAVVLWVVALIIRNAHIIPVWHDQQSTFTQVGRHMLDPYSVPGFVNPPWTAVLLAPLSILPFSLAVLVQIELYFCLLTLVIFKFGGNLATVLITLVSFIALDSVLELNLDWLVCIGLVLPSAYSGLFLLVRPQEASGYWFSFTRREFVRALIVTLALLIISLIVWGGWPLQMLEAIRINSLGHFYNIAPMALVPWPVSIAVGVLISWRAFRQHNPILAILGWLFFVPYLTFYALVLPFGLFAIRYPRMAADINAVIWLVFGVILVTTVLIK